MIKAVCLVKNETQIMAPGSKAAVWPSHFVAVPNVGDQVLGYITNNGKTESIYLYVAGIIHDEKWNDENGMLPYIQVILQISQPHAPYRSWQ